MKSILVIFNGIKFPFHLMEYALKQAKSQSASLHALFLKGKEETSTGYGFPSDLGQAENVTDSEDAREDDEKIIRHHMKLSEDMAITESIPFTSAILANSSLTETTHLMKPFHMVLLDAAYDVETNSLLTNDRFTAQDLIEKSSSPVTLVSESM
ncbi:MAG: hypothetical protein WKF89_18210 [Chitinophagaceae bacterium]